MRILKPDDLGLLFRVIAREGGFGLAVSAYACFSLREANQGTLLSEAEMWGLLRKTLQPEDIFDLGYPKPAAEFLLYGRCFPASASDTGMTVSVRVGGLRKRLQVMGRRQWRGGRCSAPEPLDPVRLDWTNAYGGPEYPRNPLGKGHTRDKRADGLAAPQILLPDALLTRPEQEHEPASFAALPPFCPQRTQFLGPFDEQWNSADWPYFPKESSADYFFSAQPDQRLKEFFKGNESLSITGAHPRRRTIDAGLPKLRARLFAMTRKGGEEAFTELPAPADTLWLLPEQEAAILCFRGVLQNVDEDAELVAHLMAAWESQDSAPLPAEHYLQLLRAENGLEAEGPPAAAGPSAPDKTAAAPPPPGSPEVPRPETPYAAPETAPELQSLQREAAKLESEMKSGLAKKKMTPESIERAVKALEPEFKDPFPGRSLEENVAALEREVQQILAKRGVSAQAVERRLAEKPPVPPSLEALRQSVRKALANPALGQEQRQALQEMHTAQGELIEIARQLEDLEQQAAQKAQAGVSVSPEPAPKEQSVGYAGKDFSGADFSGQQLAYVNFQNAVLRGADFSNAVLAGADFSGAVLSKAVFTGAHLVGARFARAQANGAACGKAELLGADLSKADFSDSDFSEANFDCAVLTSCDFSHARLCRITAGGTRAEKVSFAHADLTGALFCNADLREADFSRAVLQDVEFRETKADKAEFYGADGEGVFFQKASMVNTRADQHTNFSKAVLCDVDLSNARWSGVNLKGARLWNVAMDRSDFSKTILEKMVMLRVSARWTNGDKSSIEGSSLRRVNMFRGSLRKARIVKTRVHLANLFGADHYGVYIRNRRAKDSNIKRTLRERGPKDV